MTFTDHLSVDTAGVEDPDPSDNTVSFNHVFEVFDQADINLTGTSVSCPPRSDVGLEFTCTATATVGNSGPYGPVDVDVTFGLTREEDCDASSVDGSDRRHVSVPVDESMEVTVTWLITCAQRGYHEFLALANATLNHLHVEDPVADNANGSAQTTVQIFEPADLSIGGLDIRCTERESNTRSSDCTATVVVGNAGGHGG